MCCSKARRPRLDRDGIASDIVANVGGVREVHHMHVWSLDGSKTMATLHACLADGVDANRAPCATIKARLAEQNRHHPCDRRDRNSASAPTPLCRNRRSMPMHMPSTTISMSRAK